MSCKDIREKLVLYIKDELNESEREFITGHLGECTTCREEMLELEEIDHYLSENIIVELAPKVHHKKHYRRWMQYGLSAAAVMIITAALLIFSVENNSTYGEDLAWNTRSGFDQLEYDYYRLEYEVLTSDQDHEQLSDEDIISNSINDLNYRIDYLEEIQLYGN